MSKTEMSVAFHVIFRDNVLQIWDSLVRSSSSLLLLPRFLYDIPTTLNDLDDTHKKITNRT